MRTCMHVSRGTLGARLQLVAVPVGAIELLLAVLVGSSQSSYAAHEGQLPEKSLNGGPDSFMRLPPVEQAAASSRALLYALKRRAGLEPHLFFARHKKRVKATWGGSEEVGHVKAGSTRAAVVRVRKNSEQRALRADLRAHAVRPVAGVAG